MAALPAHQDLGLFRIQIENLGGEGKSVSSWIVSAQKNLDWRTISLYSEQYSFLSLPTQQCRWRRHDEEL